MKETKTRDLMKTVRMSYLDQVASEDFSKEMTATYFFILIQIAYSHSPPSYRQPF